ncbi:MAG TPA: DUF1837 domain-containing protein [Candidatus Massiliomicrobiota merdigallinarum]|jgi:hypothetical protein|nr:DUF1837 domain-containing protein [Candidatus Massilimicrobiota merdigallinarum]
MKECIKEIKYDGFTVYMHNNAHSFVYADFNDSDKLIKGLAKYIFQENNLLNYGNSITRYKFMPSQKNYKRLYSMIGSFLNRELEMLTFDDVNENVYDALNQEYKFVDLNGKTCVQNDKIGKIGEYIFHLLLSNYFKVDCIIPKFKLITDRNMSVFGIDALFYDSKNNVILFGESKVCKNLENAITLINRSLLDYEQQISEEYRLVLSNDEEIYNLSEEFNRAFQSYTEICVTFQDFVENANIQHICVPVFIAHGKSTDNDEIREYLEKMYNKIKIKQFFDIDTRYLFISLPIINKDRAIEEIMREALKKSNEYERKSTSI